MQKQKKTITITAAALVLSLGAAFGVSESATARQQGGTNSGSRATLGEFAIRNFAHVKTRLLTNTITLDLRGPNLVAQSPQYTMSAPHIEMTSKKGGQPARYKVVSANATGGVRIVTKDTAANRTTVLTCNTAVYAATTNPKDLGVINLRGNVTSETREPGLAEPLRMTSETGVIRILNSRETEVELTNGSITATPIEKPRPKPAGGGR